MPHLRLAIDASGGDYAPDEIVAGAVQGARQHSIELALVGRSEQIEEQLHKHDVKGVSIEIVDAPEVIGMDEDPAMAVRKKKTASIVVGCELVHDGQADALISMGHTGAGMIAALFTFGRLPGIDRPAVIVPFLGFKDTFIIDAGANTEVQPSNLLQFAIMGSLYVEKALDIATPKVGLLSNGAESNKGNTVGKQAYPLLAASGLNFVGNVEGFRLTQGAAHVFVTDGFTANIALKRAEGLVAELLHQMEQELGAGDARVQAALTRLREKHDYARVGAVPVLGVNGLVFIGHGRSKAPAVVSAMTNALRAIEVGLLGAISEGLKATNGA